MQIIVILMLLGFSLTAQISSLGASKLAPSEAGTQTQYSEDSWQFSYGTPAELKGVRSVYIATEDMRGGQKIAEELLKKLPNLTQAAALEDADVVLYFSSTRKTFNLGSTTTVAKSNSSVTATETNNTLTKTFGYGTVVKVIGPNRARVLMTFEDSRDEGKISFAKAPATNFVREFIKAFLKANK